MVAVQLLNTIFQVITDMTEELVVGMINKISQSRQAVCIAGKIMYCAHTGYAFYSMITGSVLMVVQKTTNVEPVGPAQHLLF